jgi:hypothetical protein
MFEVFAKSMMSAWLWSINWGWYHIPINTIIVLLLLFFVARLSIIRSVFCSLLFTLGAFALLTILALTLSVWWYDFSYTPETWGTVLTSVQATFYLGFLYTVLQIIIYLFVRKLTNTRVPLLLLISNMITAAIVYQMLPHNVL